MVSNKWAKLKPTPKKPTICIPPKKPIPPPPPPPPPPPLPGTWWNTLDRNPCQPYEWAQAIWYADCPDFPEWTQFTLESTVTCGTIDHPPYVQNGHEAYGDYYAPAYECTPCNMHCTFTAPDGRKKEVDYAFEVLYMEAYPPQ